MTQRRTITLNGMDPNDVQTAAQFILKGGIVAFPTETVYGLGGLGLAPNSIENIYRAKGRPAHNPLILHVAQVSQARDLFDLSDPLINGRFQILSQTFWPGPLTLVCHKSSLVPLAATGGQSSVAVRIPQHPLALELLRLVQAPIAAPSANASGRPSATHASHVLLTLNGQIDAVLDGGPTQIGIESTVIDITTPAPIVLRPGGISLREIQHVLPDAQLRPAGLAAHTPNGSPGQLAQHYAPQIPEIQLCDLSHIAEHWRSDTAIILRLKAYQELVEKLGPRPSVAITTQVLPDDAAGYSNRLYDALYQCEQSHAGRLLIQKPPQDSSLGLEWHCIWDRLIRVIS